LRRYSCFPTGEGGQGRSGLKIEKCSPSLVDAEKKFKKFGANNSVTDSHGSIRRGRTRRRSPLGLAITPFEGEFRYKFYPAFGGLGITELSISKVNLHPDCFFSIAKDMPNTRILKLSNAHFLGADSPGDVLGWSRAIGDRVLFPRLEELAIVERDRNIPDIVLQCGPFIHSISLRWQLTSHREIAVWSGTG
jgi:hypothetical protein